MATQIFINLPVKDLHRTVEFFSKLDFKFDPKFTDENATCMIVGENIFVMLLGLWIYVWTWFPGSAWSPLGSHFYGTRQNSTRLKE